MRRLLDNTLKAFTSYTCVVLLCSIPVYFLIIDAIWVHEARESNERFAANAKQHIREEKFLKPDRTYNVYRREREGNKEEIERFQGLVTYFKINGQPYSLRLEANVEESYETIFAITAVTAVFFIILLLGFIRLNRRLSKKLWAPFYQTLEYITSYDLSSQQQIHFKPSEIIEFGSLHTGINKLLSNNINVFKQQKEFTENAAHELQTPLAIVQSKLDLLLQEADITPAQNQLMAEINKGLSRINRINKNLLLLSKIENRHYLEEQWVDLSALIQERITELQALFFDRNINYQELSACQLKGNKILMEILLSNLLLNAMRYSEKGTEIHVSLSESRMLIANGGSEALDESRLFQRFGRTSMQRPGSGLGLAIVKEICIRYHWDIRYEFKDMKHIFSISFVNWKKPK